MIDKNLHFRQEARAAKEWLKNTPVPKSDSVESLPHVHSDSCGCSDFVRYLEPFVIENGQDVGKIKKPTVKEALDRVDLDVKLKKRRERKESLKIPKKFNTNFAVLDVLRGMQKKPVSPADLVLDSKKYVHVGKGRYAWEYLYHDAETGESFTFVTKGKKKVRQRSKYEILTERFALQRTMAKVVPQYRVSKCLYTCRDSKKHLSVYISSKHGTVSVSNLQTCGSVWHCPVCAAKITEKRRAEVQKAIADHQAAGGSVSFVTRTVPHYRSDSLISLRNRFRKADAIYRANGSYKIIVKDKKCKGASIKVFELTVSDSNGWHLHVHELYFHEPDAFRGVAVSLNPDYQEFLRSFEDGLYKHWRTAALDAGFEEPSRAHGLQVQNGDFAAEYFAKYGVEPQGGWGIDSELTKAHIKKAKKGYSPFDLFKLYDDTKHPDLVPILQEYAYAMQGQQQLIWSRGLKKRFGISDKTDEELVEELDDVAVEVAKICPKQWKFIVKNGHQVAFFLSEESFYNLMSYLSTEPDYPAFSLFQNSDDFD
jgi:hypothetical protein